MIFICNELVANNIFSYSDLECDSSKKFSSYVSGLK